MAFSIHDVIHHSQSTKYPDVIKKWNDISNITAETMDDGTEVFRFLRPSVSGAVNADNVPIGEISGVSKDELNEYAKKNFGGELPEVISKHKFSDSGTQLDSPHPVLDPRYSDVRPSGVNQNHGWKIHADFVSDLTKDEAYARAGRASDLSIIDQDTADVFDRRLANLGVESKDFLNFYEKNHLQATGASFIDPNDIVSASEVFQESGLTYKIAPGKYGSGRHLSAYPQSLEARDEITAKLENKLGNRLVDQNDPNYRFNLPTERGTGVVNTPISRGVSARFTTDYLGQDQATGKFNLASQFDENTFNDNGIVAPDKKYILTGEINPEQIQRINSLTAESPEIARLLHGEDGYVSPYKTIEQIAEERSTGKIPVTNAPPKSSSSLAVNKTIDEYNYKGPLPPINGRGQVSAPGTLPPTSAPSVATAPPVVAKTSTTDLSPAQMSFIETIKAEKAATEEAARNAIPATRQSIEESGYLYHYAPREARDSILSGGFDVSKARTAVGDIAGQHAEFATHVPDNSMYFYTRPEDAPSAGTIFGTGETGQRPDLYRTKIEPGMLDDMVVDPRVPLRDGVGSAVIVPSKTGKFQAELIGQNAEFGIRGDNISPATYDPISTVAPPEIKTIGAENLTEAGKARANAVGRADKVLSAMDDDELIEYLKNSQDFLAEQQKIDPDGKIFKPQAEYRLKSVEKELRDRGIHPDDAAPSVAKTSATKKGPIDIGKPVDDIRTSPTARGTDAASGGSVTPSGTPHNVATTQDLTTKNTNPTTTPPKAQAKINSQTTASGTNIATNRPAGPGNTQKAKGLLDNGLKTAQDLAGGNARLMGIAGIAGLLGVGVASSRSRTKQNPPPDRGTYMDRSRQDLDY